jgi:hypothetical protein
MSVVSNNILAGSSGQGGAAAFEIERSLRFNSADSAHLSRTPSSAGNRKTWTWSGWVKKSQLGVTQGRLFGGGTSDYFDLYFPSGDELRVIWTGSSFTTTTAVFRDPSAWYHIVLAVDTTQSTANDRIKLYVNGVLQDRASTNPSQNYDTAVNNTVEHHIGRYAGSNSLSYFNGYLADVHFIDGQALAPTDFGLTDTNGVWQPKKYTGSYGTNGFHLEFKNNSSNAAIGTDTSGNNNTWTVNNLVATAGLETSNQGFDIVTYSGNGTARSIGGLSFQPDFVWTKRSSTAGSHGFFDSVRGATKWLGSNSTNSEQVYSDSLTSFDSNGFSVGADGAWGGLNVNGTTNVAWCWKAGGAAVSNTDGTVTSSVSANTSYGFSIAKYTGNGSSSASIGHGLNSTPEWVIVKRTDSANAWVIAHAGIGTNNLQFDTSAAYSPSTGSGGGGISLGNSTTISPVQGTSNINNSNASGGTYIAYCWSEVIGFSKFGTFTHSGSNSGVSGLGFKPRYVLIKRTDGGTDNWYLFDSSRNTNNALFPNTDGASNAGWAVTFNDSGFSWVAGSFNSGTYIYAAFADKPPGEIIDSLIDTPTDIEANSGNNPGNYATLNPLDNPYSIVLSNGNLDWEIAGASFKSMRGNFMMSSGKWYFETKWNVGAPMMGIARPSDTLSSHLGSTANAGIGSSSNATYKDGSQITSGVPSHSTGDILMCAFDADAGKVWFGVNGSWYSSGDPAAGTNERYSGLTDGTWMPAVTAYNSSGSPASINFGQRPFAYTPPTGYKSLCTSNLPDPTIADGSQYFDTKLYTGNASSNTISGLNFAPDFLWLKSRGSAQSHALFDLVRGSGQRLQSNATSAEDDYSSFFTGFTSDGFTLNQNSGINLNNDPLVAWAWDAGTSTVTNNDGSIASQVRANPSAGFSICKYTVGSNTSQSIGHGLNSVPEFIVVKETDQANHWQCYHSSVGNTKTIYLNLTNAATTNNLWDDTSPTSSVFTVRCGGTSNFYDGKTHVAYCFSPVEGYSAFGSYTGNASADGTFVYTGFRPSFVMHKRTDTGGASVGDWRIWDTKRDTDNAAEALLFPSGSNAESSNSAHGLDILSNGFKFRTADTNINANGGSYLYIAFAENPFKTARAR